MIKWLSCWICFVFLALSATAQMGKIIVSSNQVYLQYADGKPFFWLGDTGWELFHRLNLSEAEHYLENRRRKGFNVIQAVALAEFNGLTVPNRNGQVPFKNLDPDQPNESYFLFLDSVIQLAEDKQLYIGPLPTWGDKVTEKWGAGPVIFNELNAYKYAKWLAERYKDRPNIIWILGGDRPPQRDSADWTPIWRAMAKGILDVSKGNSFVTYHIWGGIKSTSHFIHHKPWLMMNTMQSGHGGGRDVPVWEMVSRELSILPRKPTLDMEPNYEDHPVNPWPVWNPQNGHFRDYDVRKQCFRSVFAGAAGLTYGHHSVWQFWSQREEKINYADRYWTEALDRLGAFQVGYLKSLILSRSPLNRVPDQSVILSGQGTNGEYAVATRDLSGTYIMVYLPIGKAVVISTEKLNSKNVSLTWFNPRTNECTKPLLIQTDGKITTIPPQTGGEHDWVLILDGKD
jgi:hypothetical protein